MSQPEHPVFTPDAEIARFDGLAADWWDETGPMAPLHRMNPVRLTYIKERLNNHFGRLDGLKILDIGCGGGLVTEPLARLGANVTGIDGAGDLIRVARDHAAAQGLGMDYVHGLTGDLVKKKKTYDAVLALEVIEHVDDAEAFVSDIAKLLKPGGLAVFSTLNRTASSFALGIVAAEYVLRWLPAGTHDWRKFVKPSELHALCVAQGLSPQHTTGMTYSPVTKEFRLDARNLSVNYFLTAVK